MENIWALDGTHTGAVVLYDGFDEQARHEHMSDEYKDRYIIRTLLMTLPSVLQTVLHHTVSPHTRHDTELGQGVLSSNTTKDLPKHAS